jgi:hypothetical protein
MQSPWGRGSILAGRSYVCPRGARALDLSNNRSRRGIGFRDLLMPRGPGYADYLRSIRGTELDAARLGSGEGGRCALTD